MTAVDLRHGEAADAIRRHRLIVILRRVGSLDRLVALIEELADAGARVFEVTFDDPDAAEGLRLSAERLGRRRDGPFRVGAGTIRTADQLAAAHGAGAAFGVSPTFNRGVLEAAIAANLPFLPGAATPTEVEMAWECGATFVKLFPASSLGPTFVREIRGPMPEVELVPTGGVNLENARQFLDAGAAAVGLGSALLRADPDQRRGLVAGLAQEIA